MGQVAGVHLLEVLAHDERRLHEEPAHADGVGLVVFGGLEHLVDVDLDAEVHDLVAVVGEDDVDQVLADVVDVTLDGGQHHGALAALVGLLHVGLEVGHGRLHGLGRLQHEGELHLPGGEELPDRLHAGQEEVVDDGERGVAGGQGLGQVVVEAVAVAVDDPLLEAVLDGPSRAVLGGTRRGGRDAFEEAEELLERVIALATAVVDEVEADLPGPLVDLGQRDDRGPRGRWPRRARPRRTRGGTSS